MITLVDEFEVLGVAVTYVACLWSVGQLTLPERIERDPETRARDAIGRRES